MRENKDKYIGFRDTETFKNKLKQIADNHNMNVSEYVRYCVYKELETEIKK